MPEVDLRCRLFNHGVEIHSEELGQSRLLWCELSAIMTTLAHASDACNEPHAAESFSRINDLLKVIPGKIERKLCNVTL